MMPEYWLAKMGPGGMGGTDSATGPGRADAGPGMPVWAVGHGFLAACPMKFPGRRNGFRAAPGIPGRHGCRNAVPGPPMAEWVLPGAMEPPRMVRTK